MVWGMAAWAATSASPGAFPGFCVAASLPNGSFCRAAALGACCASVDQTASVLGNKHRRADASQLKSLSLFLSMV